MRLHPATYPADKARHARDGISLQSWITWICNNAISLGYGVFHLHDPLFIITVCSSLTSQAIVIGMIIYNRHFRFRERGICLTSVTLNRRDLSGKAAV